MQHVIDYVPRSQGGQDWSGAEARLHRPLRRLAVRWRRRTVCPLSNVALRCVDFLSEHPLRRTLDAGLAATVNSDDPAYFGGYLHDNVAAATRALGLTLEHRRRLAENSFHASFLPQAEKDRHLATAAAAG